MKLWIARNKDGYLRLWKNKPKRGENNFMHGFKVADLYSFLYPEVTWENSPKQVELKLIEK